MNSKQPRINVNIVCGDKGGAGKSTTTRCLIDYLLGNKASKKILVVDTETRIRQDVAIAFYYRADNIFDAVKNDIEPAEKQRFGAARSCFKDKILDLSDLSRLSTSDKVLTTADDWHLALTDFIEHDYEQVVIGCRDGMATSLLDPDIINIFNVLTGDHQIKINLFWIASPPEAGSLLAEYRTLKQIVDNNVNQELNGQHPFTKVFLINNPKTKTGYSSFAKFEELKLRQTLTQYNYPVAYLPDHSHSPNLKGLCGGNTATSQGHLIEEIVTSNLCDIVSRGRVKEWRRRYTAMFSALYKGKDFNDYLEKNTQQSTRLSLLAESEL